MNNQEAEPVYWREDRFPLGSYEHFYSGEEHNFFPLRLYFSAREFIQDYSSQYSYWW